MAKNLPRQPNIKKVKKKHRHPECDEKKYCAEADKIRKVATAFIEEWYGMRCDTFDQYCEICKRFKSLDRVLENPF